MATYVNIRQRREYRHSNKECDKCTYKAQEICRFRVFFVSNSVCTVYSKPWRWRKFSSRILTGLEEHESTGKCDKRSESAIPRRGVSLHGVARLADPPPVNHARDRNRSMPGRFRWNKLTHITIAPFQWYRSRGNRGVSAQGKRRLRFIKTSFISTMLVPPDSAHPRWTIAIESVRDSSRPLIKFLGRFSSFLIWFWSRFQPSVIHFSFFQEICEC